MQQYLISDLAKKTQLSTDTIRFYEKKNLIQASFRAKNNYKYYNDETLKRLIFIKRCRALDMTLQEIIALLEQVQHPERGCKIVDQLIAEHIQHVETRILELQSFKTQLVALRQSCASDSTIDHCQIVKNLAAAIE
ncbi:MULTISPECIES: Cd(II)/Pb(II)-responsive transcriptional regulator [Acinetobacter]|uniref:Cd(II)/Pb(II)-responsive transcriptional regulator n=1 Tax=Acinetobacter piscicola TaxID=2006115 RepID=A0A7S6VZY3_9GAMM|nr:MULTISPECIES: Cd(II)/Pb(II)-responsive transcriptional regulator [Acinetobacter]QOW47920.1 Cd(II)/Pb(II)-responsive transcriptional regulator [Acinetobacter piscicola]